MNDLLIMVGFILTGTIIGWIFTDVYNSNRVIDAEFDRRYFQMEAIKYKCERDNIEKKYYKLMEEQVGGDANE